MSDTTGVWAAVHAITEPTRQRLGRDHIAGRDLTTKAASAASEAARLQGDYTIPWRDAQAAQQHARLTAHAAAAGCTGWAVIPSLWHQAVAAIISSGERDNAGTGSTPLRERSVGDLGLLETVATIRDTVAEGVRACRQKPVGDVPGQMRHLTSEIIRRGTLRFTGQDHDPEFWGRRCRQWERLLRAHLDTVSGPRPVHLRNTRCPVCDEAQHTVIVDGDRRVVPALLIDFSGDEKVRAAWCQVCGTTWWRGELEALAATLAAPAAVVAPERAG